MINWVDCLLQKKKKMVIIILYMEKEKKKKMGVGRKPSGLKHLLIGFTNMETLQFNIRKIILDDKATVCLNFKSSPLFIISIFFEVSYFLRNKQKAKNDHTSRSSPKRTLFFFQY